jgi:O-succinylbenzoic acid--CoA ligase
MAHAFQLHISNACYRSEDIRAWNEIHSDPYVYDVLMYCKKWIIGQEVFNLNTSGSTGQPKTIQIHRDQIEASAKASLDFFKLTSGDVVCCPISIHVIGGQMMLYRSIIGGLQLHIIHPSKTLVQLNTSIQYAFMPITALQLFELIYENNPNKIKTINNLRHLLIGGSSVGDALLTRIKTTLQCNVWHSFGMTETVSHIAMKQLHPISEEAYTTLDGIEIDIDTRSCLKIKGAITQSVWIQTNDCIDLIDEKHFTFLGRADFTVNSGGIKIQVEPIEKIIGQLFEELNISIPFFLAGMKDAALGEKLILLMDGDEMDSTKQESILQRLNTMLPKYHAPKSIYVVAFEYTTSGKINRTETCKKIERS